MVSARSAKRNYVTDSVASTFRTLVAGLVALIVNPFIIRSLSDRQYSGWTLALSIGAYVPLAETGVGTAIIRYVAPDRTGRSESTTSFLASALLFASIAGAVVMAVVGGLVGFSDILFGNAPESLRSDLRVGAGLAMISGFFGLWTSVANGYFAAQHQTVTSALVSVCMAVLNGFSIIYVARRYHSIPALTATVAAICFIQAAVLLYLMGGRSGRKSLNMFQANRSALGSIWAHCLGTGWWSLSMLLIGGLDLFLVARVDYANVGSFGIAARLVGLVLGLLAAATTPLMTIASRSAATSDAAAISRLLIRSTRLTNCGNALVGGVLFSAAPVIVEIYAGEKYVHSGAMLLRLLLVGNMVRQLGGSLGLVMVATGEHRKAVIPPIAEGLSNLSISVILGSLIGAAGVAIGTIFGAVVSLILYNLLVFPKFRAFTIRPRLFFIEGVLPASLVFAPALLALPFQKSSNYTQVTLLTVLAFCAGLLVFARLGLKPDERLSLISSIRVWFSKHRNK